MSEREKVIKGLECCANEISCIEKCPYNELGDSWHDCVPHLAADALELLSDPDLVRVVRCENCICWEAPSAIEKQDGSTMGHCRNHYGACENQQTDMNWFCADGEREG